MKRQTLRTTPRQPWFAARVRADAGTDAGGAGRANRWLRAHLLPSTAALVLLLGLALAGVLLLSPEYKVSEVLVEGADLLDAQAIRSAAGLAGRSIISVAPRRVEALLRERFVVIAQVSVERRLPNRVEIRLLEQPARWAWESAGRYWWLRANGTVIGEMPDAGRLPVIHDMYGLFSEPGSYIPGVPWELAEAMLAALPVIPAFDYSRDIGLIVYVTEHAWPVYLGTEGNAVMKTEVLRSLVKQLTEQQAAVAYIDLRNEMMPVYKKSA